MSDEADEFTLVRRKKRGKDRQRAQNERQFPREERKKHLESLETGNLEERCRIDKVAVQKKIFLARDELTISDFYTSFKDLLVLLRNFQEVFITVRTSSTPGEKFQKISDQQTLKQTNNSSVDGEPCPAIISKEAISAISHEKFSSTQTKSLDDSEKDEKLAQGQDGKEVTYRSVQVAVCYGLGNFSECAIARYQLALLMLACDFLKLSSSDCHVYDPRFTSEEKQILTFLGMDVIPQNEEGKRATSVPTLFYMPHCGKPLYNNLLWANWSIHKLSNIVVIGNSFSSIRERLPSRLLEKDYYYLNKIMPYMRELPVKNNFRFADIFNDTSIHWFPLERLREIPASDWDQYRVPQYDTDVETEIIVVADS